MTALPHALTPDGSRQMTHAEVDSHIADLDRQIGAKVARERLLAHTELTILQDLETLGANESAAWREGYRQVAVDAAKTTVACLHLAIDIAEAGA